MQLTKIGFALERFGHYLMLAGGLAIAAIFLIVLVNGSWPIFLSPVQTAARTISSFVGDFVWLFWVAIFIGPGWLISTLGARLMSTKP